MRAISRLLVALTVGLTIFSCNDISLKGIIQQELGAPNTRYFLYVTNNSANTISGYSINISTGALTEIAGSPFATGTSPRQIAVSPKGNFLYVTAGPIATPGAVFGFTINTTTGALTSVGAGFATGFTPQGIAVDPAGKFVFVANQGSANVSAFAINTATGALTTEGTATGIAPAMVAPAGVAVDTTGQYVFVTDNGAPNAVYSFSINAANGMLSPAPTAFPTGGTFPWGIAVDPSGGYIYVANQGNNGGGTSIAGYMIGGGGALATLSGSPYNPGLIGPTGIVVDPTGKFVYVANNGLLANAPTANASISAYTITSGNGSLVAVGGSPFTMSGSVPSGIVVDPTGKLVYMTGFYSLGPSNSLYAETITAGTGALSAVSGSPILLGVFNPGIAIASFTGP